MFSPVIDFIPVLALPFILKTDGIIICAQNLLIISFHRENQIGLTKVDRQKNRLTDADLMGPDISLDLNLEDPLFVYVMF